MEIVVTNAQMSAEEQQHYVQFILRKYPRLTIEKLVLTVDGNLVNISIIPQRRVLTKMGGTFIGDPLFWNTAKRAEYFDTIPNYMCFTEEQVYDHCAADCSTLCALDALAQGKAHGN